MGGGGFKFPDGMSAPAEGGAAPAAPAAAMDDDDDEDSLYD